LASASAGHVSLHVPDQHPPEVHFLFEHQSKRLSGALGVSFATHVAAFVLMMVAAAMLPAAQPLDSLQPHVIKDIVWLAVPGPGGGGGGGGNKSPDPPQRVELPGKQRITVPVQKPVVLENPKPKDEPTPEQQLVIPAKALASAEQTLPGVLTGLPAPPGGSQGIGTGGGAGGGTGSGVGEGTGSGLGPGWGGGTGGGAYRPGNGVTEPRLVRDVKPQYTSDAMRAKIQGVVWLECIVQPDGSVAQVNIVKSLDPVFGLDQEAVKAAKQWKFVPGLRNGQPVPVYITIEMTFTLR
jgi:TonB family protein